MENKRKRTENFTNNEKALITELVVKHQSLVENKRTDATTNAEKAKGWKYLCGEFNSISNHCYRNADSLKTCWENIKRQSKKQSASRKREHFMTGGGRPPPPPPSTGAESIIGAILEPALEGLENPYDSDAFDTNNKEKKVPESSMCDNVEIQLEFDIGNTFEAMQEEPNCEPEKSIQNDNVKPQASSSKKKSDDDTLKWEGWTPNSLKRPLSECLKHKDNAWLRRRRPDKENVGDQLIRDKINLVKTLINNAQNESEKRLLILEEQLKQEKIKTNKLENDS